MYSLLQYISYYHVFAIEFFQISWKLMVCQSVRCFYDFWVSVSL